MSDVRYSTIGGETCQNCGKKFKMVWEVSDSVWKKVIEKEEGIICLECFDSLAAFKGVSLQWLGYIRDRSEGEGHTS